MKTMQFITTILILLTIISYRQVTSSFIDEAVLQGNSSSPTVKLAASDSLNDVVNKLFDFIAFTRRINEVKVVALNPLRIRAKIEMISPLTNSKDYYHVDGMLCQNGFTQDAANAVCRSLNNDKGWYQANRPFYPTSSPRDKFYFQYNQEVLEIPPTYLFSVSNCPPTAMSLQQCDFTKIYEHQCAGDMHVAVVCL